VNGISQAREEITLFDSKGRAAAYISTDDDLTIYMWGGKPVAYLDVRNGTYHVYGFNGIHLGRFEDGVLRDGNGDVVDFTEEAVDIETGIEPMKSLKGLRPLKSLQELPPLKPLYSDRWPVLPLPLFLKRGAD
jgi:hypothetical protein